MTRALDPIAAELVDLLDDDLDELFHERAAIREFEGEYTRAHAEALALLDVVDRYPDALSGVTVFAIELESAIHWVVTTDKDFVQSALARRSTKEVRARRLAEVVRNSFGGRAFLAFSQRRDDV